MTHPNMAGCNKACTMLCYRCGLFASDCTGGSSQLGCSDAHSACFFVLPVIHCTANEAINHTTGIGEVPPLERTLQTLTLSALLLCTTCQSLYCLHHLLLVWLPSPAAVACHVVPLQYALVTSEV